jgi:hypothetical protein
VLRLVELVEGSDLVNDFFVKLQDVDNCSLVAPRNVGSEMGEKSFHSLFVAGDGSQSVRTFGVRQLPIDVDRGPISKAFSKNTKLVLLAIIECGLRTSDSHRFTLVRRRPRLFDTCVPEYAIVCVAEGMLDALEYTFIIGQDRWRVGSRSRGTIENGLVVGRVDDMRHVDLVVIGIIIIGQVEFESAKNKILLVGVESVRICQSGRRHGIRVLRSSFARLGSFLSLAFGRLDLLGLLDLLGVRRLVTDLWWLEVDRRVLTERGSKGLVKTVCDSGTARPGNSSAPSSSASSPSSSSSPFRPSEVDMIERSPLTISDKSRGMYG